MGRAIETVLYQGTALGATLTTMNVATGEQSAIRNHRRTSKMVSIGSLGQAAGSVRVASPLLHDAATGITLRHNISGFQQLMGIGPIQQVQSQDVLSVQWSGSATAGDIEQVYLTHVYEDLPGVSGRFITAGDFKRRSLNLFAVTPTIATAGAGGWAGEEAIFADMDNSKANTDYAIVGVVAPNIASSGMAGFKSPDWGNLRIGCPIDEYMGRMYFLNMAESLGEACIPVFNSANKSSTLVSLASNETAGTITISVMLCELK